MHIKHFISSLTGWLGIHISENLVGKIILIVSPDFNYSIIIEWAYSQNNLFRIGLI